MKVRVEMEMLAMVVVLYLTLGVSDAVVVDKCELGRELNSTLPANLLDKITNLVAKIVCHAELSSNFNTSTINQTTGPEVDSVLHKGSRGRKSRSAEASSEESSEESTEETSENSSGAARRRRAALQSSSEESSKENIRAPKPTFNSSTVNSVTRPQGNNSSNYGDRRRKGRSAEASSEESSEESAEASESSSSAARRRRAASKSSSEESSKENIKRRKPAVSSPTGKPAVNSSMVNPVTLSKGNNSSTTGGLVRKNRSAESSSEECSSKKTWTLYGLFQLPDRVACMSGLEPSLNLCSMTCDSLVDDNISDDITCVETILSKMLSSVNSHGPTKELFSKLYAAFFQKECKNVKDSEYFSSC